MRLAVRLSGRVSQRWPLGGRHQNEWGVAKTARTFGSKWASGSVG